MAASPKYSLKLGGESDLGGKLVEDEVLTASGKLVAIDSDAGATLTWSVSNGGVGQFGKLTVDATGNWTYVLDNADVDIQSLAKGEKVSDSFTVQVTDSHGLTATRVIKLKILGTDDQPTLTGTTAGSVQEDVTGSSSGQLALVDIDGGRGHSDRHEDHHNDQSHDDDAGTVWSVVGGGAGTYGKLSIDQAGHWTYVLDNGSAAVQALAAGTTQTETFTVKLRTGDHDGDDEAFYFQDVHVSVAGTNDAPTVSGPVSGSASEDAAAVSLNALGNASDIDQGSILTVVGVPSTLPTGVSYDAATHSFTLDPSHAAFQSLAAGATTKVTVDYGVSDGQATVPASVSWTVTGTNDAPKIVSSTQSGAVTEDGVVLATGQVSATDADLGDGLAYSGDADGAYGSFTVDAATGVWTYALHNSAANVQALAAGESHTETFLVTVTDNAGASVAQGVTIQVNGTADGGLPLNHAPVVTGALNGGTVYVWAGAAFIEGDGGGPGYNFTPDAAPSVVHATANASDVDGDSLSVASITVTEGARIGMWVPLYWMGPDSMEAITFNASDNTLTLDANHYALQGLQPGETATLTVTYDVSDGQASTPDSVSWTLVGTDDPSLVGWLIGS